MKRVVITGLGLVTPLGVSLRGTWKKMLTGTSFATVLPDEYSHLPCRIASVVGPDILAEIKETVNKTECKTASRGSLFLLKAASDAMEQAQWLNLPTNFSDRCGVSIGIGFDGALSAVELSHFNGTRLEYSSVGPYALTHALGNMPAAHLSIRFGLRGPSRSVNTACAAGLNAIGDAFRIVQSGDADLMIAGGVETPVCPWSIAAFSRIRALPTQFNNNPSVASRPFDESRSGFVISEGAGVVVLESLDHAKQRSATPLVEIVGFGQSCDAFNLVAPDSTGDGAYRAMRAAIENASLDISQVSYINAHATSTPQGDIIECKAIERLFGKSVLVSSFKGQLGHSLGAAGAIETVLTAESMLKNEIPPNGNLRTPDPMINVNLVRGGSLSVPWTLQQKVAVKNSLGFGGTNCSLVLRQYL